MFMCCTVTPLQPSLSICRHRFHPPLSFFSLAVSPTVSCCQSLSLPQISSLQNQIHSQETDLQSQEEELSRAKADLNQLQLEESQLEQSLTAGKFQLETIIKSLKATQDEINQVRENQVEGEERQQTCPQPDMQKSQTL